MRNLDTTNLMKLNQSTRDESHNKVSAQNDIAYQMKPATALESPKPLESSWT